MYDGTTITKALSVPSTASTTTIGEAFDVPVRHNALLVTASLAAHTGGPLDVYLQDSSDGVTWTDCAHFTQLLAGVARVECGAPVLSNELITVGQGTTGAPGVALAAAKLRPAPWRTKLRIVAVTGAGTSGVAKTQTITVEAVEYES